MFQFSQKVVEHLPNAGGGGWGLLSGRERQGTGEGTAGRKDLGLQRRVRADLRGPGYGAFAAERGAQRGCWALPGHPKLKHLSIWFELWLKACLLISPCRRRGVGADGASPAPERDPEPGGGHHGVGPGSTRRAFLSRLGQAAPCPASSISFALIKPRCPLFVLQEPWASQAPSASVWWFALRSVRSDQSPLGSCGCPGGSGTCPLGIPAGQCLRRCAWSGSPGAGSLHSAPCIWYCPAPSLRGPSVSWGPASAAASLTTPPPPAMWGCLGAASHLMRTPGAAWSWGPGGSPAAWRAPPCRASRVLLGFCFPRSQACCASWRPCVRAVLDCGPRGDGPRQAPPPSGSLWLTSWASGPADRPCSPEQPPLGGGPACISTEALAPRGGVLGA